MKIVSGGQAGADLGGILFALRKKIPCEIRTHANFVPVRGRSIPEGVLVRIVTEYEGTPGLIARTRYNVEHSDLTLIILRANKEIDQTRGSRRTADECSRLNKPYAIADLGLTFTASDFLIAYVDTIRKGVLNIAGERWLDENEVAEYLERVWPVALGGKSYLGG